MKNLKCLLLFALIAGTVFIFATPNAHAQDNRRNTPPPGRAGDINQPNSVPAVTTHPVRRIQTDSLEEPPPVTDEQIRRAEELMQRKKTYPPLPVVPDAPLRRAPPVAPETKLIAPEQDAFLIQKNTPIMSIIPSNLRSTVSEPSVAEGGNNVFVTGNWFAAYSFDGGNNFSYISPFAAFPNAAGGFCCDQDVIYDPGRGLYLWYLQYVNVNTTGNIGRLAYTTNPASGWSFVDIAPEDIGAPFIDSDWFDYPHMALSNNYLYITSNVFNNANSYRASQIIRFPLAQLAAGGTITSSRFFSTSPSFYAPVQGATDTIYFSGHINSTLLRIYSWAETGAVTSTDVFHAHFNSSGYSCVDPSGRNSCASQSNRKMSGWVANGRVGIMWVAAQGTDGLGTFPYPYARVLVLNQSNLSVIQETALHNSNFAFIYPSIAPNSNGAVAGSVTWAGAANTPTCGIYTAENLGAGTTPAFNLQQIAVSTHGPDGNRWGDYLRTRRSSQPGQWVSTCFSLQGSSGTGSTEVRYLRYGVSTPNNTRFDYDGDGKADISVYRPMGQGIWYITNSSNGAFVSRAFGDSTDKIVPADYDGDGKTELAVFRQPATIGASTWFILPSITGIAYNVVFGTNNDIPTPGDFDGDGKADIAVFRPSNGTWYIQNSSNNTFRAEPFGTNGDIPVFGDYDGDSKTDVAVFRPSNGAWYVLRSSNNAVTGVQFGTNGDLPVTGDYDGDGKFDYAVYRPSAGAWYISQSSNNAFAAYQWGLPTDRPVPADYDGDRKTDIAVFRPSNGIWYIIKSTGGMQFTSFGSLGDDPTPTAYVPVLP